MRAAKIENNIIVQVIEGSADWANEKLEGTWIDINGFNIGLGYTYLPEVNKYVAPQPFPSWSLDFNYVWQPPTAYPTDGLPYEWDETTLSWTLINLEI